MLRFAKSPTNDMDLGDLRVAIFNFILSKQLNVDLLIRIDDTQKEQNIEGKEKEILELLSLFSIEHKHVVYQSEHLKYHQKMAMQLMTQKKAFACFCSDEKLDELKDEAKKEGKLYAYDGFCSTLSDETVLNCNAPFTVRIEKPVDKIQFNDILKGKISQSPSEVDSFFILNQDKSPTYNYACAVDDMLHNISYVVRSDEYLLDTSKQIHVRKSLGYDKEIKYLHVPDIISNGQNTSVKFLIDEGFLPSAIANYVVLLGCKTPTEIFTLEDAIEWFDIENISNTSIEFDMDKLRFINRKHLEIMDEMRLSKILGFADSDIGKLGKIFIGESSTIHEIKSKIDLIFSSKVSCESCEDEFKLIKEFLKKAPYFNNFNDLLNYLTEQTGLDQDTLVKPLQYLLTGRNNGPSLCNIYPFIKNYLGEIIK